MVREWGTEIERSLRGAREKNIFSDLTSGIEVFKIRGFPPDRRGRAPGRAFVNQKCRRDQAAFRSCTGAIFRRARPSRLRPSFEDEPLNEVGLGMKTRAGAQAPDSKPFFKRVNGLENGIFSGAPPSPGPGPSFAGEKTCRSMPTATARPSRPRFGIGNILTTDTKRCGTEKTLRRRVQGPGLRRAGRGRRRGRERRDRPSRSLPDDYRFSFGWGTLEGGVGRAYSTSPSIF